MNIYGLDQKNRKIKIKIVDGKIHDKKYVENLEESQFIIPGFIDIHTHGGYDYDWINPSSKAATKYLNTIAKKEGITSVLGTTITTDQNKIINAINQNSELIGNKKINGATLLGFHLEGPFLNEGKKGAHPSEHLVKPTLENVKKIIEQTNNSIKVITIALELADDEVIYYLKEKGIIVSLGHTLSDVETFKKNENLGLDSITHFNNAMPKINSTHPELGEEVLKSKKVNIELINDGVHVDEKTIQYIYKKKDHNKLMLVTDSISVKGLKDGIYKGPNWNVEKRDGAVWTPKGILNGSTLTMIDSFKKIMMQTNCSLDEAVRFTSTNQARLLKLKKGEITEGYDADILVLDENFNIKKVFVGGKEIK